MQQKGTYRARLAVIAASPVDLHPVLTQERGRRPPVHLRDGRDLAQPRLRPAPLRLHDGLVSHAHLGMGRTGTGAQLPVFRMQTGRGLRAPASGCSASRARDLDLDLDLCVTVVVGRVGGVGSRLGALLLLLFHFGQIGALVEGLKTIKSERGMSAVR